MYRSMSIKSHKLWAFFIVGTDDDKWNTQNIIANFIMGKMQIIQQKYIEITIYGNNYYKMDMLSYIISHVSHCLPACGPFFNST